MKKEDLIPVIASALLTAGVVYLLYKPSKNE